MDVFDWNSMVLQEDFKELINERNSHSCAVIKEGPNGNSQIAIGNLLKKYNLKSLNYNDFFSVGNQTMEIYDPITNTNYEVDYPTGSLPFLKPSMISYGDNGILIGNAFTMNDTVADYISSVYSYDLDSGWDSLIDPVPLSIGTNNDFGMYLLDDPSLVGYAGLTTCP